jgi:hypothetical protein
VSAAAQQSLHCLVLQASCHAWYVAGLENLPTTTSMTCTMSWMREGGSPACMHHDWWGQGTPPPLVAGALRAPASHVAPMQHIAPLTSHTSTFLTCAGAHHAPAEPGCSTRLSRWVDHAWARACVPLVPPPPPFASTYHPASPPPPPTLPHTAPPLAPLLPCGTPPHFAHPNPHPAGPPAPRLLHNTSVFRLYVWFKSSYN